MSATDLVEARRPKRRTNEERSAEMRAALIEAAIESLCDVGYAKTTTQEICRRAKATSGAIQHHFGAKDELLLATLDYLTEDIQRRLAAFITKKGSLEARCRALVQELWEAFYGLQRYMAVWEIAIGSRGDPTFKDRVLQQRIATLKSCEDLWRRTFGITERDPREKVDSMHFTLSFLRGFVLYNVNFKDQHFIQSQLDILTSTLVRILGAKSSKTARHKRRTRG
jgi:AcrR family transcriptional regulator